MFSLNEFLILSENKSLLTVKSLPTVKSLFTVKLSISIFEFAYLKIYAVPVLFLSSSPSAPTIA